MKSVIACMVMGLCALTHDAAAQNVAGCSTREANIKGGTTVTYVNGSGPKDPATCAQYKDYVSKVVQASGYRMVNVPNAAGIVPGAFDTLTGDPFKIDIGGSFKTLPDGLLDKTPVLPSVSEIWIRSSSPLNLASGKLFGVPFPSLRTVVIESAPTADLVGLSSKLLNANLGKAQSIQLKAGNKKIPADLFANMGQLRQVTLTELSQLTEIPADLLTKLRFLKGVYISGTKVTSLPATLVASNARLTNFDMRDNTKLTTLPATLFSKNPTLNQAYFIDGALTAIPDGIFSSNPKIFEMVIGYNSIATIGNSAFSPQAKFDLSFGKQTTGKVCKDFTFPAGIKCNDYTDSQ